MKMLPCLRMQSRINALPDCDEGFVTHHTHSHMRAHTHTHKRTAYAHRVFAKRDSDAKPRDPARLNGGIARLAPTCPHYSLKRVHDQRAEREPC